MPSDETLLLHAIRLARASRDRGNHPFGALLASVDGEVLLEAENSVVTGSDPTGHAETNLVRLAGHQFDRATLATTILVSSTEPCAMCAGAIYWSGIGALVFALAESELLALTGSDPHNPTLAMPCRVVFAAGQRPIEVRGPFDLPEARDVHHGFWHPPGETGQ